jgi:lipopolysaccharide transport system ATP-binding protein
MADFALKMDRVYKKFTRSERHDSLRDLLPALLKGSLKRVTSPTQLRKEEFWALHDVSFEIPKGQAVGIIGHNGAGKSTMLKHLSGLMKPTLGKIEVHGRLSALIEVGAGFHQDLTGRENVYLNGVILGMSREEVRRKFDEIVAFAELTEFIDMPVKRYSSGMYARLGFSVAAHLEPDILIVDEVLSVGDMVFQNKSFEKMRSVMRGGTTVIFVSHNLKAVADLCERSLFLQRGRLIQDGPTTEVIQHYMEAMQGTRADVSDREVVVERVVVRDQRGPRADFDAGEKAWIDVTVRAIRASRRVAVVLMVFDQRYYEIFNTSTERLGEQPVDMQPGEERTVTFEVSLHLAAGSFHVGISLYRYDISHLYDQLVPASTVLIRSPADVKGAVNLYPSVIEQPASATRALLDRAG